jgi:hypothetical protein
MSRGTNTGAQLDEIHALMQEVHTQVIGVGLPGEAPVDSLAERLERAIEAVEGA